MAKAKKSGGAKAGGAKVKKSDGGKAVGAKAGAGKRGADFEGAFAGLKKLLARQAGKLSVKEDKPGNYYLESKEPCWKGQPMFFGAVQTRKGYVSFHLMPVYVFPELLKGVSAELKKRMQGKSCFNFAAPEEKLFAELGKLVEAGLERFEKERML